MKRKQDAVIANTATVALLNTGTDASSFHRIGKYCEDKFRLKTGLRTDTKLSGQPLRSSEGYHKLRQM